MKPKINFILTVSFLSALTSCSLRYLDAPPVGVQDRWLKDNFTPNDIYHALLACGFEPSSRNEALRFLVDKCMLSQGFIFIDSPYGEQGSICMYPDYQLRPSCQSLKSKKFKNQSKD